MDCIDDRFTFDNLFRFLLREGLDNEEAKDYIINNYSLGLIPFQERIENEYYLEMSADDKISPDLLELKNEIYAEYFFKNKN